MAHTAHTHRKDLKKPIDKRTAPRGNGPLDKGEKEKSEEKLRRVLGH